MTPRSGWLRARIALSLIELLVLLGIVGVLAGLSTPLYVGWRANSLNAEATRSVEQFIATTRADAKRRGIAICVIAEAGADTMVARELQVNACTGSVLRTRQLPNGGSFADAVDIRILSALGTQAGFEVDSFDVVTGRGPFNRSVRISVIPPLAKTAVDR